MHVVLALRVTQRTGELGRCRRPYTGSALSVQLALPLVSRPRCQRSGIDIVGELSSKILDDNTHAKREIVRRLKGEDWIDVDGKDPGQISLVTSPPAIVVIGLAAERHVDAQSHGGIAAQVSAQKK